VGMDGGLKWWKFSQGWGSMGSQGTISKREGKLPGGWRGEWCHEFTEVRGGEERLALARSSGGRFKDMRG